MRLLLPILFLATVGSAMCHHLDRIWTDSQGRSVKAELLKVEGASVVLLLPDGRQIPYAIAKLSQIDQAFIKKFGLDVNHGETAVAIPDNFDDEWPDEATIKGNPRIATIEENVAEKKFVYESANYRYQCDAPLLNTVIGGFAVMFEATHQYCRELPLSLNSGVKTDGKYQIILFEHEKDYISAGGPPGSAGVYIPHKNIVMVPLTSLGVQKFGSGYTLDRDKGNKTLPHELVHQLTPPIYYEPGSDGWFTEGVAEYVAVTPYRSGSFGVRSNFKAIIGYVTAYGIQGKGGRGLGHRIAIGPLKAFMMQPYSSFAGGSKANFNYGCGLLITNYFFHMDGDGDAKRIKAFLKAMKAGKKGEEALAVLLDGRTWEQLQAEIAAAYAEEKVTLTF